MIYHENLEIYKTWKIKPTLFGGCGPERGECVILRGGRIRRTRGGMVASSKTWFLAVKNRSQTPACQQGVCHLQFGKVGMPRLLGGKEKASCISAFAGLFATSVGLVEKSSLKCCSSPNCSLSKGTPSSGNIWIRSIKVWSPGDRIVYKTRKQYVCGGILPIFKDQRGQNTILDIKKRTPKVPKQAHIQHTQYVCHHIHHFSFCSIPYYSHSQQTFSLY